MKMIKIGQVVKPFGIKGELKVYSYTDFPLERFCENAEVFFDYQGKMMPMIVKKAQLHKGLINVQFEGYDDINDVEKFRVTDIYYDQDKIKPLNKGEYYIFEIKGLKVYDTNNQYLGQVINVELTGTHNNLRIQREDKTTFLIPNIPVFVKSVDLVAQKMVVELIEGLG